MASDEDFFIGSLDGLAYSLSEVCFLRALAEALTDRLESRPKPPPKAEPFCKLCKLIAYEKHLAEVDKGEYMLLRSGRRVYKS